MTDERLKVFISSTMGELAAERKAIKSAYDEMEISAWVYEDDAGAQPISGQQAYKEEIDRADYYVGIFWREYGKYTIDEFDYATEQGKERLIYEKRTDVESNRDPELQAFLDNIGDIESGVAVEWFETAEELSAQVKKDMARLNKRTKRELRELSNQPNPVSAAEQRSLDKLRRKVNRFWIEGVLESITRRAGLVELDKNTQPDAVASPWEAVLEVPNEESRVLDSESDIAEVFDDVDRSMLILGEPGSGKTTSLLTLARTLLERARTNSASPVPVVFHLSSGVESDLTLSEWLVRELYNKYEIPAKIGRSYVENQRLILLLDGLDEVARENREQCVEAINQFAKDVGYPGIVVCCRSSEYDELAVKLNLEGAICLRPLSDTQIDAYMQDASPDLAGLRAAIRDDDDLRDLARSPLMLNLMCITYPGYSQEALAHQDAPEMHGRKLFSAYIDRMFSKRKESELAWPREKLVGWLSWVAKRLCDRSQAMFRIEGLQPAYLEGSGQRSMYIAAFGIVVGLFLAVASIVFRGAGNFDQAAIGNDSFPFHQPGEEILWLIVTPVWLLAYSIIENVGSASGIALLERPQAGFSRTVVKCLVSLILWIVVVTSYVALFLGSNGSALLGSVVWSGIAISFIVGVLGMNRSVTFSIRTVETLRWSFRDTGIGVFSGLCGGAIVGLVMGPLGLLTDKIPVASTTVEQAWWLPWVPVLGFALAGLLIGLLVGGYRPYVKDSKTTPNQGIRLSARMGLQTAAHSIWIVAIAYGVAVIGGYTYTPNKAEIYNVLGIPMFGTFVGLFTVLFLIFGGLDVLKHYILRALLAANRQLPWNVARLLEEAHRLNLMQRAGNAYLFVHRRLRDYLAASDSKEDQGSNRSLAK